MKFTQDEVARLIKTITEDEKIPSVDYKDFLKHSYLFQLFKNHVQLEHDLREIDVEGKGLIQVGNVNQLLQDAQKDYKFPPDALVTVFNEMLGSSLDEVDPACIIKIDAFMESLKQQFEEPAQ